METWKPIPGYEGYYEASDQGRIRSVDRIVGNAKQRRARGCVRAPTVINGYEQVGLSVNGIYKDIKVHRAVALAFLPNPDNKPQVNHKNGIRNDNRLENLEWVTCSENHRHAFDVLGKKASKAMLGKPNPYRKLSREQVEAIKADPRPQARIAADYGVCQQTVSNVKQGYYYRVW